ncbi:MAG TPA: hypothetical protein VM344_05680 [Vitreimonas sp.]|jgi:hypothetical protein|nr:hypothetical protein [Vitreimonas sp.]
MSDFRLLAKFEETFRQGPYLHRNSQLGNRIADFLFDDLYLLDPTSRFHLDVDAGRIALNPKGVSPGLRARRGDGSFGPVVPGYTPLPYIGHVIPVSPTAEVDLGAEVKILAKAMIKQIDRVISDLCGQSREFKTKSPDALTIGLIGLNVADRYVSFEGARRYPTGDYGPHPYQEAPEAERRLLASAEPCYQEFLILPFRASNDPPFQFDWARERETRDRYGAMLTRLLRSYERGRPWQDPSA